MASIWSRSNEGREGTEPPLKDSTDAKLSTSEAGFHMGHPVKKKNYSNIQGSTKIQTNFVLKSKQILKKKNRSDFQNRLLSIVLLFVYIF